MISLIMHLKSSQNTSYAQAQELPLANAINKYWQPIQTWSTAALSISQNGLVLSASATTLLVILILYALYIDRKDRYALINLYRKLSKHDQLLIKAVNNTKKTHPSTTQAITLEYQKLTHTTTSQTEVAQKINQAQKTGTIKKTLLNKNDTPTINWKNQVPHIEDH